MQTPSPEFNPVSGLSADRLTAQQASCLLLTLDGPNMLVPRMVVADVLKNTFIELTRDEDSGLEFLEWRSCQVPLVNTAVAGKFIAAKVEEEARLIIFYGLTDPQRLPFYAIMVSRGPQLLQVSAQDMEEISEQPLQDWELMKIKVQGNAAFIPKVDHFERSLLRVTQLVER
jgi:hypothetical protein